MASRIGKIEYFIFAVIGLLLILSASKYYDSEHIVFVAKAQTIASYFDSVGETCLEPYTKKSIGKGGYVCLDSRFYDDDIYTTIYSTYPRNIKGKDNIYALYDDGEIEIADKYVANNISIPRFEDFSVDEITWAEDPYGERYWRFVHYSLRELRHLFYAWEETGEQKYLDAYTELLGSWLVSGKDQIHSWDDPHGVAFRAMFLTDAWWDLRDANVLSHSLSNKILLSIDEHGSYLTKRQNYQAGNNHGVTQASALILLGAAFPDLPGGSDWENLGVTRLNEGIADIVDEDGVLIENSPYYHFYALEKYWETYFYAKKYDIDITDQILEKIDGMINYGIYMLKPDSSVPLLGASIARTVFPSGYYKEMVEHNDSLEYVLTHGEDGDKPKEQHIFFPHAGKTIFRSGWGDKRPYTDETHFIFDTGPFRTSHSDYDAFTFNLYSNGHDLIVDSGLYTYEDVPLKEYFQGTQAHNTVVVDGQNQRPWRAEAGEIVEESGMAHQTAAHTLYEGVTHYRTVLYVDHENIVIIDNMVSDDLHSYSQMFHLPEGIRFEKDNLSVTGTVNEEENASITIHQLIEDNISFGIESGDETDIGGWCSDAYEIKKPCFELSYNTEATSASYITHLQVGNESDTAIKFDKDSDTLEIRKGREVYSVSMEVPSEQFEVVIPPNTREADEEHTLRHVDGKWALFDSENKISPYFAIEEKNGNLLFKATADGSYKFVVNDSELFQSASSTIFTTIPANSHESSYRKYEQEDFLPILGYHHVIPDGKEILNEALEMHVSDYRSQIEYATLEIGCNWYTFGDLMENYVLKNKKTPPNACAINFDDSNKTDYTQAMPVLDEFGALASFFVYPERLDISTRYMTWDQVDELHRKGHEIGSHTLNSSGLVSSGWNAEELYYQLNESKLMLEGRGYGPVRTFAYPSGESNDFVVQTVKKAGYIGARDIAVPNKWRDRRATTANMDPEYIWHMNYYKPEFILPANLLENDLTYTSWWQFEEGFVVLSDEDFDVEDDNKPSPTKTSYGVVELPDANDAIRNKFVVRESGTYYLTLNVSVSEAGAQMISVFVDGEFVNFSPVVSEQTCSTYDSIKFCEYRGSKYLQAGPHVLTTYAQMENVFLDKFNMYRMIPKTDEYKIDISYKSKGGEYSRKVPSPVIKSIDKTSGFFNF